MWHFRILFQTRQGAMPAGVFSNLRFSEVNTIYLSISIPMQDSQDLLITRDIVY